MPRLSVLPVSLAALLVAPSAISADVDAKTVYEYRETLFGGFGQHMKAMSFIAKGKIDRPASDLAAHAKAIHETSKMLTDLFPEGTGPDAVPDTEALPAIWKDWAGFEAAANKLTDESAKLVEIAAKGDLNAAKAQFGAVGKACGNCHDSFRKDED